MPGVYCVNLKLGFLLFEVLRVDVTVKLLNSDLFSTSGNIALCRRLSALFTALEAMLETWDTSVLCFTQKNVNFI